MLSTVAAGIIGYHWFCFVVLSGRLLWLCCCSTLASINCWIVAFGQGVVDCCIGSLECFRLIHVVDCCCRLHQVVVLALVGKLGKQA